MFGNTMGDLYIQAFDGTNWMTLDSLIGEQQTAETDLWLKRIVDLSAFTGSNLQVRFLAISGACCRSAIALDDIAINEVASCPEPSSLGVNNLLANSTDLTWTENGSATEWGTGALLNNITANPFNLTGLIDNTCYDFYVRADCGPNDSSLWVGPYTFCTPCTTIDAPWIDSVETHLNTTSFGN